MKKYIFFIIFVILFSVLPFNNLNANGGVNIVIDKSFHVTIIKDLNNKIMAAFPDATGTEKNRDELTPTGNYYVNNKTPNPKWRWEGKIYAPYIVDQNNGLGIYWVGYNLPAYALHGTNEPFSIGKNASHGCIRHQNNDILKISKLAENGTRVNIIQTEINSQTADTVSSFFELYDLLNILKNGDKNI
jgi:hypothetical protein